MWLIYCLFFPRNNATRISGYDQRNSVYDPTRNLTYDPTRNTDNNSFDSLYATYATAYFPAHAQNQLFDILQAT